MYIHGQHTSDKIMNQYVDFIITIINPIAGASVNSKSGFPMKGNYVPVNLSVQRNDDIKTVLNIKIEALGFEKEFQLFLSRLYSPAKILNRLQEKITIAVNQIVDENGMDRDEINKTYHPFSYIK